MAQVSEKRVRESEEGGGGLNYCYCHVQKCITGLVLSYVESPQKSKLELISSSWHHSDNNTITFTERSKVIFKGRHGHTS